MGKPPVKTTAALTKAKVKAELQAKASWKRTKAGVDSSLRDHIGRMIDKIDPVELIAVIGLTIAVHEVIMNSQELLVKARSNIGGIFSFISAPLIVANLIRDFFQGEPKLTKEQLQALDELRKDPLPWVVSFGIAYFLIKNGQQILSLPATVAGFFGLVPV